MWTHGTACVSGIAWAISDNRNCGHLDWKSNYKKTSAVITKCFENGSGCPLSLAVLCVVSILKAAPAVHIVSSQKYCVYWVFCKRLRMSTFFVLDFCYLLLGLFLTSSGCPPWFFLAAAAVHIVFDQQFCYHWMFWKWLQLSTILMWNNAITQPPRAPLDHIWAMIWSGARGNITITAL